MTFYLHQHKCQINYVTRYKDNAECWKERLYYTVIQYGCNHIYHCIVRKSMNKTARLRWNSMTYDPSGWWRVILQAAANLGRFNWIKEWSLQLDPHRCSDTSTCKLYCNVKSAKLQHCVRPGQSSGVYRGYVTKTGRLLLTLAWQKLH